MNLFVGEPINGLGNVTHVSTGDPVVSDAILKACGIEAIPGSAAPQPGMGSGIADLVSKPKPMGLG